jgi:hypothetical protein
MTADPNDVVKLASGSFLDIEMYKSELDQAGITCRVVGLNLEASFGTAIPNSVELWVHRADAERAASIVKKAEEKHRHHDHAKHPHPVNDPKPQPPHTHKENWVNPNL